MLKYKDFTIYIGKMIENSVIFTWTALVHIT